MVPQLPAWVPQALLPGEGPEQDAGDRKPPGFCIAIAWVLVITRKVVTRASVDVLCPNLISLGLV